MKNRNVIKILGFFITLIVVIGIGYSLHSWWYVGNNIGYAPEQPLPFSHKLHAGDMKIPCSYCHIGVEESPHAVVPSQNICMNCHQVVKTESPHIQKLTELYNKNTPVEWIRVHDLPDHVRFNHARHISKGIACASCHGEVEKMEKIKQVTTLQMGFCLDCHRKPEINASINCQSCHY